MSQYNFAVVILSFNHPELTEKTIQSVLNLHFTQTHLFLVHNGSENQHRNKLKSLFPKIQHLDIEINKGFTGGVNFGLSQAFLKNFKHVLFLTNDTELVQIPSFFESSDDFLSPVILKRKTSDIDSVIGAINIRTGHLQHLKNKNQITQLRPFEKIYIPGTAFVISKKCFESVGLFDESFHTYWEDVDYSLRASQMGYQLNPTEKIMLRHKIGKTCHKDRFYTLYLFQRNRKKLMNKHHFLNLTFLMSYSITILKLFFRILIKPNRQIPLQLLWKALYE